MVITSFLLEGLEYLVCIIRFYASLELPGLYIGFFETFVKSWVENPEES